MGPPDAQHELLLGPPDAQHELLHVSGLQKNVTLTF